ncbi:MAG: HepT-like ribonuclease domain-containing protein [Tunicatimonas sp.]|uniref:HepT-like ribonuclease domain-containing protein n=1 Tax=Tunicatimonas sp. TaxID=1940096 RepID=UPI003C772BCE
MISLKAKKYLYDIVAAIERIEEFLGDQRDFHYYQQNALLRSGVERQLIIMGEAVNRLRQLDATIPITASQAIVQFRNRITHEYD